MNSQNERFQLYGNFGNTISYTRTLLLEFKSIFDSNEVVKKLPHIEWVYLQIIIINLAIIFSDSKNEPFRLKQLKNICSKEIKTNIQNLEKEHEGLISKIKVNRRKLFAHRDKDFHELGFSDAEIRRWVKTYKIDPSSLKRAEGKNEERYVPIDLNNDFDEIKLVLDKLYKILMGVVSSETKE